MYIIINVNNGKFYIGKTEQKYVTKRWNNHRYRLNGNTHYNYHLQQAWNKYGENSFKFEILHKYVTKEELLIAEIVTIAETNACDKDIGYNITGGGEGAPHSEETKHKMSLTAKERFSDKENHPFYGKHHTNEAKNSMSKTKLNDPVHMERITALGKSNKGKKKGKHSDEQRNKMSVSMKAAWTDERKVAFAEYRRQNPVKIKDMDKYRKNVSKARKGKKHTEETKAKQRMAATGRKFSEESKEKRRQTMLNKKKSQ